MEAEIEFCKVMFLIWQKIHMDAVYRNQVTDLSELAKNDRALASLCMLRNAWVSRDILGGAAPE